MCELIKANRTNDDRHKSESLLKIKNAISKEATRFSGYQQHVSGLIFRFNFHFGLFERVISIVRANGLPLDASR